MEYEKLIEAGALLLKEDALILEQTAEEIAPELILEVGSYKGGSTVILGQIAKKNFGQMLCVEPEIKEELANNIIENGLQDTVTVIEGLSPWIGMSWFSGKPIDYLFIDGTHYFRWVLVDYHYFEPFVRIGGRIAFHDYKENRQNEVWAAVQCLRVTEKWHEIAKGTENEGDGGIIVFQKDAPSANGLKNMRTIWNMPCSDMTNKDRIFKEMSVKGKLLAVKFAP